MSKDLKQVTMGLTLDDRANAEVLQSRLQNHSKEHVTKAQATSFALGLARFIADELHMPVCSELLIMHPGGKLLRIPLKELMGR